MNGNDAFAHRSAHTLMPGNSKRQLHELRANVFRDHATSTDAERPRRVMPHAKECFALEIDGARPGTVLRRDDKSRTTRQNNLATIAQCDCALGPTARNAVLRA